jgi:beta-glucosidase/6-phospho-beta-glucosidase/beta-galactosidase
MLQGPPRFLFSTGIENSYPSIPGKNGGRERVDELESCGHYRYWKEDFALVKELGLACLRYGPPLHKTHLGPGRYDWSFTDEAMNELKRLGITPIVDLCHFGVPDWLENFQNPAFPEHFAEYARAFAHRYPWVRHYTPVNEIFIAATFSAQYGWWNECLRSDRAFVTALHNLCRANVLAMNAILLEQPWPIFIQSESSEYFHARNPNCLKTAAFQNEKRFLALDLTYGQPISAMMYEYLLDNGLTRDQYHFFRENRVKARCVMGNDYYITNEHMVEEDGTWGASGEIFGYYVITHQYFRRYNLPVMHTETNLQDAEKAPDWLMKEWANVHRLKQDGVPILGFTWYSLNDQIDWDNALREKRGVVNPCGLTTLDRKIRPVGYAYQRLVREWGELLPMESFGLGLK